MPDRFFDIVTLSNFAVSGAFDALLERFGRSLRVPEQVRAELAAGTIGILKALCIDHTITSEKADAILARMVVAGFYSPVRRISDLL